MYVCTNISCSLRGADELYEAARAAAAEDPEVNVRAFECLGACDIAPMASVDGVYVGPLTPDDVPALLDDIRAGRAVLPEQAARAAPGRRSPREQPRVPRAPVAARPTIARDEPRAPGRGPRRGDRRVADERTAPGRPPRSRSRPEHDEEDSS